MKNYETAGAACVLAAVAVSSCALGMFLQSRRNKADANAVVAALKDENRRDTVKALGHAAAADPVVSESLKEALQEREITLAQSDMVSKVREQQAAENSAQSLLKKKHRKLIEESLLSLARGDIEDAKLSLDLARSYGIDDPETHSVEMKVEAAIHDKYTSLKKEADDRLQAQKLKPADPDPAKKKARNAGDQNPFE